MDAGLADAVGNMAQYLNERAGRAQKEQFDAQNTSIVHNITDGTVQVNMPADVFKEKAEAAAKYDQISALYMKQVQDLETQRAQIKAHPFANTLAQIAGSMAASDSNPVTAGLGRAALRLNPTDAELQAREQHPLEGALRTQTQRTAAIQGIERTDLERQGIEAQKAHYEAEAARYRGTQEDKKMDAVSKRLEINLRNSQGKELPEKSVRAALKAEGFTDPDKLNAKVLEYQATAQQIRQGAEDKQKDRAALISQRGEEARKTAHTRGEVQFSNFVKERKQRVTDREAVEKYKNDLKKDNALALVPPKHIDELVGFRQTEKYLDDLEAMFNDPKLASKMGFFQLGRVAPIWAKETDRVKLENMMAHETPRILQLVLRGTAGGASLLRTEEGRQMVAKMGASTVNNLDQARAIIGNIREVMSKNRQAVIEASPEAEWGNFKVLLGSDAKYADQAGLGGGKKSYVRTGTDSQGRKVGQLPDGTIEVIK